MTPLQALAKRLLGLRLARLRDGHLVVRDGHEEQRYGSDDTGPAVVLHVRDPRFYSAVALGGHLGAAEAYVDGWWETDQLTEVVRLLVRNRDVLESLETGWARFAQPIRKGWHALNRNTRYGSRRNIVAHYDLGNEFFAQILDDTLTYSCGVFERPDASLRDASVSKYDRICRKLQLSAEDHLLEIGTGWGGFAVHAARKYGCRVTTTTISPKQHEGALQRVTAAGLAERITVLKQDYRDLTGRYDKLVSIEMIEAVGHQYFDAFFRKCRSLLEPTGNMVLQAITIDHRFYDAARREVDFIKRYIFPGSCIPSLPVIQAAASRADLTTTDVDEIGPHYAETLRRWRTNLEANWHHIRALGFSEELRRLWRFYFCYCEGGFRERVLGDVQLTFTRSATRRSVARYPAIAEAGT